MSGHFRAAGWKLYYSIYSTVHIHTAPWLWRVTLQGPWRWTPGLSRPRRAGWGPPPWSSPPCPSPPPSRPRLHNRSIWLRSRPHPSSVLNPVMSYNPTLFTSDIVTWPSADSVLIGSCPFLTPVLIWLCPYLTLSSYTGMTLWPYLTLPSCDSGLIWLCLQLWLSPLIDSDSDEIVEYISFYTYSPFILHKILFSWHRRLWLWLNLVKKGRICTF